MQLYRFIDARYGLRSLAERRLKFSRLDEQNDPFELFADRQADRGTRARIRRERKAVARQWGMLCFCADWQSPVLWGHYADRLRGLCLGFEIDPSDAVEVSYIDERLPAVPAVAAVTADTLPDLARMKFKAWEYEQEHRVWCRLDPAGPKLQYAPFGPRLRLTHVYLGARSKVTTPQVQRALGDLANDIEIVTTRIAFESFAVVTQNAPSLQR